MPRIPIDHIYMNVAYQFSKLSYAERRRVGSVIVKDNQIVSFGYNGTPHGFDNKCEDLSDIEDCLITRDEVLHAESNAIAKIAKSVMSSSGADLYVTMSPCFECSKLIIQSGIKEVFYSEEYRDYSGIDLLRKANIKVTKIIIWDGFQ